MEVVAAKKAKKAGQREEFTVTYVMDEQSMENRLVFLDNNAEALRRNIDKLNLDLDLITREKAQIEAALGRTASDVKTKRKEEVLMAQNQELVNQK